MTTIELTTSYTVVECANCHMAFALAKWFEVEKRRDHKTFYCPSGHSQHFPGESDLEKAERLARNARRDANDGWAAYTASQDQLRATERSRAALKGHLTRVRKTIANGVCPVAGCRRHFDNVQAHIAGEHPGWGVLDPETGEQAVL